MEVLVVPEASKSQAACTSLSQYAGMLAHELRNPLAAASTNLAVAVDLLEEGDPRAPFMERAEREIDRVASLIDSFLTLARSRGVQRREVDVQTLARELEQRLDGRGIDCDVSAALKREHVIDETLVARAVDNLCENALRALDGGGQLRVAFCEDGHELVVRVEDSGPGVAEELEARVFEPYVSGGNGSGLGLSFVQLVAEQHAGSVRVARSSQLGGAQFELRLRSSSECAPSPIEDSVEGRAPSPTERGIGFETTPATPAFAGSAATRAELAVEGCVR